MTDNRKAFLMRGLFGNEGNEPEAAPVEPQKQSVGEHTEIALDDLVDYHSQITSDCKIIHPFHRLDSEKKEELKDSIKENGLLHPIIVRKDCEKGKFEILSGHNRADALRDLGFKTLSPSRGEIKVIEADDMCAASIMLEANIQREQLKVMEKAWACRLKVEVAKKQKRDSSTAGIRSDELAAQELNLSRNTVNRYMRLTYLIDDLANLTDLGKLQVVVGVELSYLPSEIQTEIVEVYKTKNKVPNLEQAKKMRDLVASGWDVDIAALLDPPKDVSISITSVFRTATKHLKKLPQDVAEQIDRQELSNLIEQTISAYISKFSE